LVYDAITDREKSGKGTPARVTGIDDEGALTVRFEDGREVALSSGEVTLKV
jgi:biotin-(acetyl-CoA carboxylase) ligase